MAGHGPAPKEAHQRERDTRRRITERQILLVDDGEERGPSLEAATGRSDWSLQARTYWQTWRTAPQAQAFETTDWQRLAMLVPLVEAYWIAGGVSADKGALAEIRLNEERLGATVADRQRLRMKIEEAQTAEVRHLSAVPGDSDADLLA